VKGRIVFDRNVLDADVDRLKKQGYPDDLIELFIDDGQARARAIGTIGSQSSLFNSVKRLLGLK